MAIVWQKDKRSGITYAYESISHWDKEKKQSRAKRMLVGRVNVETGEIVPTRGTNRAAIEKKRIADDIVEVHAQPATSRQFAGATYLLDSVGDKLGIEADLKKCFPDKYKQMLSLAYYLVLELDSPLGRFSKWASIHDHPCGQELTSQRISELFSSITESARYNFFRLQAKRRCDKEFWAYDITSISSYSDCLRQVKYGFNKEDDKLPQLNLALLFGQESNLPFYYRKLPGNISDVKTVRTMLSDIDFLDINKVHLVMDRGFYSADNMNRLYQEHYKFLIGTKLSLKYVKEQLENQRNTIRNWENYNEQHEVFATCVPIKWEYTQKRPYKGDVIKSERRMYLHIYFNGERALEDEQRLTKQLLELQRELVSGNRKPENAKLYQKYFDIHETPVRGVKVAAKQEAIDEAKKNYGYFALVSNVVKCPNEALDIYRNKDLIEKAFGNLKERLNIRRLRVSSEKSLEGKLFVEFIALIYLSHIKKNMQTNKLFAKYTMQEVLDQLDVIEKFKRLNKNSYFGEITKNQTELFRSLSVEPPSSL